MNIVATFIQRATSHDPRVAHQYAQENRGFNNNARD